MQKDKAQERARLVARIGQEAARLDSLHDALRLALDQEAFDEAERHCRQLTQALNGLQADLRAARFA